MLVSTPWIFGRSHDSSNVIYPLINHGRAFKLVFYWYLNISRGYNDLLTCLVINYQWRSYDCEWNKLRLNLESLAIEELGFSKGQMKKCVKSKFLSIFLQLFCVHLVLLYKYVTGLYIYKHKPYNLDNETTLRSWNQS